MAVDYSSFNSFITSTLGRTIGEGECWDYINLIWNHLGSKYWTYPPGDSSATNHGVKWGWINTDARAANTISGIVQVPNLSDVITGDIMILSYGTFGHAGFVKSPPSDGMVGLYSQNWDARYVTLDTLSTSTFVGAFRYTAWSPTPPPPPVHISTKKKFPWVLYARKLREKY